MCRDRCGYDMMTGMMRATLDFGNPLPAGWSVLSAADRSKAWAMFATRFGELRPGMDSKDWPAIVEPSPSVTFDLGRGGKSVAARIDAVNAEALRCSSKSLWTIRGGWSWIGSTPDIGLMPQCTRAPLTQSGGCRSSPMATTTRSPGPISARARSAIPGSKRCACSGRVW